jgi:IclR family acetate operon transcriptional repressor
MLGCTLAAMGTSTTHRQSSGSDSTAGQRQYRVPAADGLLSILELLVEDRGEHTLASLVKRLTLSKNMAFRIVHLLERRGYLEQGRQPGTFRPGVGLFRLAARLDERTCLIDRAREHLAWLCRETGDTASLQCPDGERMVVQEVVHPPDHYGFHLNVGLRLLYHCNAMGKCVLAHLDPVRLRAVVPETPQLDTPRGPRQRVDLIAELETVRMVGLGYDREEYLAGVCCVAAPVFDAHGAVVGGVGITSFSARSDGPPMADKERLVREAGRRISAAIGFDGSIEHGTRT